MAFNDSNRIAAYRGAEARGSFLLARLYVTKFLIENDQKQIDLVRKELADFNTKTATALDEVGSPARQDLARGAIAMAKDYAAAFEGAQSAILARNDIINNQLDKIGPEMAVKLDGVIAHNKTSQDELGPRASAEMERSLEIALTVSGLAIVLGLLAAFVVARSITRPIGAMTVAMGVLAGGDVTVEIPAIGQKDEIGAMAAAVLVFKDNMIEAERLRGIQAAEREAKRARVEAERIAQITMRHAAALEIANKRLVAANRELSDFNYIASHDLQEPLRKIVTFSQFLVKDLGRELPEAARADVHYMTSAASRMQSLVQDLLALSRMGHLELRLEPLNLAQCFDAAVEALSQRISETGAQISRDELPEVLGDRTLLTQLLQNLLGNALKFVAKGTAPNVRMTAQSDEGRVVFGIRDNGIGIEPRFAQQVFAPFKRLHGRDDYEGTGIGLSICRKVVARHGGEIWVESVLGQGAHFKFTLGETKGGSDE